MSEGPAYSVALTYAHLSAEQGLAVGFCAPSFSAVLSGLGGVLGDEGRRS